VVASLTIAWAQAADERLALIIGNSAYTHTSRLKNPINDARALSEVFRRLDYKVRLGIDQTKADLDSLIDSFSHDIKKAEVAVFFYAGHGMQIDSKNYIVPVDFDPESDVILIDQLLSFDTILNMMTLGPRINIVMLDACRDNPLATKLASNILSGRSLSLDGKRGVRLIGQGLAEVEGGVGTLIAYATQPGNVASDGAGDNSPFTAGMLQHLETEGLEIREFLTRVRRSVVAETSGKQIPWDHSSLVDRFFFRKKPRRFAPPP
jgi:uncharacterized caspase-like protein